MSDYDSVGIVTQLKSLSGSPTEEGAPQVFTVMDQVNTTFHDQLRAIQSIKEETEKVAPQEQNVSSQTKDGKQQIPLARRDKIQNADEWKDARKKVVAQKDEGAENQSDEAAVAQNAVNNNEAQVAKQEGKSVEDKATTDGNAEENIVQDVDTEAVALAEKELVIEADGDDVPAELDMAEGEKLPEAMDSVNEGRDENADVQVEVDIEQAVSEQATEAVNMEQAASMEDGSKDEGQLITDVNKTDEKSVQEGQNKNNTQESLSADEQLKGNKVLSSENKQDLTQNDNGSSDKQQAQQEPSTRADQPINEEQPNINLNPIPEGDPAKLPEDKQSAGMKMQPLKSLGPIVAKSMAAMVKGQPNSDPTAAMKNNAPNQQEKLFQAKEQKESTKASYDDPRLEKLKSKIIQQVRSQMKIVLRKSNNEAILRLKPEMLGKINVKIEIESSSRVTAHFVVENNTVKEVLQKDTSILRQSLEDRGLEVDQIEIDVADREESNGRSFHSAEDRAAVKEWTGSFRKFGAQGEDVDVASVEGDETVKEIDPNQMLDITV